MRRTVITTSPKLLLRSWKQFQGLARISSKAAKPKPMIVDYSKDISDHRDFNYGDGEEEEESSGVISWVPHPRTGIFFPPGQESVMEDVPDGAASFEMKYWFRNVEGVDKSDPDRDLYHLPY